MLKIENGLPIVYKDSKTMGVLVFKEISKELAKDMCIKYHYAHKWNVSFGIHNIGVFKKDDLNNCLGVASYGWIMHPENYKQISNDIKKEEILELNRLWINDCLGKNAETMLISASLKILKQYNKYKVIQSFADGRLGCGTIYKAASFKYYGYHITQFFENVETKEDYFLTLITDTRSPSTVLKLSTLICDDKMTAFMPNTYRYIYCLDKKIKLNLKELPYPEYQKGKNFVDINDIWRPSKYNWRGANLGIFRGYIISKLIDVNMNSSQIIAKKLLKEFNHDELNNILNKQKDNVTLHKLFDGNPTYEELLKIENWIDVLQKDSKEKQKIIKNVELW